MHYYKFNIGDFISHTLHLSDSEELCYRRLLDHYYLHEKPITQNNPMVSRKLRCDEIIVAAMLEEFFELTENGWINTRADEEIAQYHGYLNKQKTNGIKGGRPKKTHGIAKHNPSLTQNNPKQETITIKQETITNTKDLVSLSAQQSKNGSRLSDDWVLPDDWLDDAAEIGLPTLTALSESIVFRDYWIGVAGAKGRKADWRATWRNWVRRKAQDRNNQPKPTQSHQDNFIDKHTDASWADGVSSDWRGNPL